MTRLYPRGLVATILTGRATREALVEVAAHVWHDWLVSGAVAEGADELGEEEALAAARLALEGGAGPG